MAQRLIKAKSPIILLKNNISFGTLKNASWHLVKFAIFFSTASAARLFRYKERTKTNCNKRTDELMSLTFVSRALFIEKNWIIGIKLHV